MTDPPATGEASAPRVAVADTVLDDDDDDELLLDDDELEVVEDDGEDVVVPELAVELAVEAVDEVDDAREVVVDDEEGVEVVVRVELAAPGPLSVFPPDPAGPPVACRAQSNGTTLRFRWTGPHDIEMFRDTVGTVVFAWFSNTSRTVLTSRSERDEKSLD